MVGVLLLSMSSSVIALFDSENKTRASSRLAKLCSERLDRASSVTSELYRLPKTAIVGLRAGVANDFTPDHPEPALPHTYEYVLPATRPSNCTLWAYPEPEVAAGELVTSFPVSISYAVVTACGTSS